MNPEAFQNADPETRMQMRVIELENAKNEQSKQFFDKLATLENWVEELEMRIKILEEARGGYDKRIYVLEEARKSQQSINQKVEDRLDGLETEEENPLPKAEKPKWKIW